MNNMSSVYWWVWLSFFFGLSLFGAFVLFFSPARTWVLSQVNQQEQILSVAHGDLMNDGSLVKVIKYKTLEGIVLEFYTDIQENGSRSLISRVEIPNAKDGFFDHRGQAVQLAVADLDGDGTMELLSPTFDANLLAWLNPYYYSKEEKAFLPFFFSKNSH